MTIRMKILCEAQGAIPAMGLCECGSAVELDRDETPCPSCERRYTRMGRLIPQFTGLNPQFTLPTGERLKLTARIGLAISAVQKRWQRRRG